jgi:hypothetical protein
VQIVRMLLRSGLRKCQRNDIGHSPFKELQRGTPRNTSRFYSNGDTTVICRGLTHGGPRYSEEDQLLERHAQCLVVE